MDDIFTVVLGGGRGTRLQPLTLKRAKPAVPLGGKYRLIDIPISNAINSGLRKIYVLTQFNSASLNRHITRTYRFDQFSQGFVEVLAAEQTETSGDWYQGTADAVRQQIHHFDRSHVSDIIILSGDHLYRMDYSELLARHWEADADVTVACIPVTRAQCEGFGVLSADREGILDDFREKPGANEDISHLAAPMDLRDAWGMGERDYLASMGIYVFKRQALRDLLADHRNIDFGHHVIPGALKTHRVAAFLFDDYWADIGTIGAFYEANLALCGDNAPFEFLHERLPIYTRARFLPPAKVEGASLQRVLLAEGAILRGHIENCVIGLRSVVQKGAVVKDSIVMGADFYYDTSPSEVPVGIGEGASVRRAIIDKNARIGAGAIIHGAPDRPDEEHDDWAVRDGIVVVAKGAVIPPGSVL